MNDKVRELLAKQSYKGTPVITLRQLTEALSVGKSTIRSNLCVNKDKFVEGVDYFRLNGQELLSVKREGVIPVNPAANVVMLLSQKGVNTYLSLKATSHQGKALPGKQQKVQQSLVTTKTVWSQEPVLTTEQLANFYKTTTDNIKVNFNRNQDRFVEGKHYFKLEGQNLVTFKNCVTNSYLVQNNTSTLYLWTKRGAARHAKMLHTDKAWEVFEQLEDTYFAVQEGTVTQQVQPTMNREEFKQLLKKINAAEEQKILAVQKLSNARKQLAAAENTLATIETDIKNLYKTINVSLTENQQQDIKQSLDIKQNLVTKIDQTSQDNQQPLLDEDCFTLGQLHSLVEDKMSLSEFYQYCKNKDVNLSGTFDRGRTKISAEDAATIMATLGITLNNLNSTLQQQTLTLQQVVEKLQTLGYNQLQDQNLSVTNLINLLKEYNLPLSEQPHLKGFSKKNSTVTKQTFFSLLSLLQKPS